MDSGNAAEAADAQAYLVNAFSAAALPAEIDPDYDAELYQDPRRLARLQGTHAWLMSSAEAPLQPKRVLNRRVPSASSVFVSSVSATAGQKRSMPDSGTDVSGGRRIPPTFSLAPDINWRGPTLTLTLSYPRSLLVFLFPRPAFAAAMSDRLQELILRRTLADENGLTIFDRYTDALEKMGNANLGANDFQKTFERVTDEKGKFVYITKPGGTEFCANIIAEVGSASQGTWMPAYPKKNPPPNWCPFGDEHNPHRMVIAARCPTGATLKMEDAHKEFLACLDGTRDIDEGVEKEKGQEFHLFEWTSREENDKKKPADLILLRLKPTYDKPYPNRARSPARRVRNSRSTSPGGGDNDVEMAGDDRAATAIAARKVGDTYLPDMLPDHKGEYFAHEKAKLVQPTEGTLFSVQVSLSMYVMKAPMGTKLKDSKIYHVNVEKLTILDPGYGAAWRPAIPTLPTNAPATPKSKRVQDRDTAVDSAFDDLSLRSNLSRLSLSVGTQK
ncbi:hypothetical protein B0H14DRAFT_3466534 [Mycena olivaceomarginata]|nr:hypothetical protein B0H14DRAFT_3466534 [Mycena olivaceomarginata]